MRSNGRSAICHATQLIIQQGRKNTLDVMMTFTHNGIDIKNIDDKDHEYRTAKQGKDRNPDQKPA